MKLTINNDKKPAVPFGHAYWVIPGKFLAGFYPGAESKENSYQKLKGPIIFSLELHIKM